MAEMFSKSQKIMDYVKAVKINIGDNRHTVGNNNDLENWVIWASKYAQEINPLKDH